MESAGCCSCAVVAAAHRGSFNSNGQDASVFLLHSERPQQTYFLFQTALFPKDSIPKARGKEGTGNSDAYLTNFLIMLQEKKKKIKLNSHINFENTKLSKKYCMKI